MTTETNELLFANDSKDLYPGRANKHHHKHHHKPHTPPQKLQPQPPQQPQQQQQSQPQQQPIHKDSITTKLEQRHQELDEQFKQCYNSFKEAVEEQMMKIREQATKMGESLDETVKVHNTTHESIESLKNSFLIDHSKDDDKRTKKELEFVGKVVEVDNVVVRTLNDHIVELETKLREKDELIGRLKKKLDDEGLDSDL